MLKSWISHCNSWFQTPHLFTHFLCLNDSHSIHAHVFILLFCKIGHSKIQDHFLAPHFTGLWRCVPMVSFSWGEETEGRQIQPDPMHLFPRPWSETLVPRGCKKHFLCSSSKRYTLIPLDTLQIKKYSKGLSTQDIGRHWTYELESPHINFKDPHGVGLNRNGKRMVQSWNRSFHLYFAWGNHKCNGQA